MKSKSSLHTFSSGIKQNARYALLGHLGTCVGVTVIYLFFYFVMYEISGGVFPGDGVGSLIGSVVTEWLLLTLFGLIEYGNASIYISLQYGQDVRYSKVFSGFKESTDKILKISSVLSLISILCLMPATIFGYAASFESSTDWVIYGLLQVLGIIVDVYFALRYSMCYYLLLDYPDNSWKQCLSLSAKMMKGRKGKLLYLYLSFLPMGLLCFFSLGIGALWVLPYFFSANAAFYRSCVSGS